MAKAAVKAIAYPLHYLTLSAQKQAFELIENMIKTRTAEGKDARRDLYAQVADQLEDNPEFRQSDIWSEALFLIPAGKSRSIQSKHRGGG